MKNKNKQTVRRIIAGALCVVCAGATAIALQLPAKTLTYICGQQEHAHSDACYFVSEDIGEPVLVCTIPEHAHSDACIAPEAPPAPAETPVAEEEPATPTVTPEPSEEPPAPNSGREAKTETVKENEGEGKTTGDESLPDWVIKEQTPEEEYDGPPADESADLESAAYWSGTVPASATHTGVWGVDVIATAKSQLGYAESKRNFIFENGRRYGYSRYGAWYGVPYGDWCAMFVSFCLYYSGVPSNAVPYNSYCPTWTEEFDAMRVFHRIDAKHIPEPGDIIFFTWNSGEADHVGFVNYVENGMIYTIEGNTSDRVGENTFSLDSSHIYGYASLSEAYNRALSRGQISNPTAATADKVKENNRNIIDQLKAFMTKNAKKAPAHKNDDTSVTLTAVSGVTQVIAEIPADALPAASRYEMAIEPTSTEDGIAYTLQYSADGKPCSLSANIDLLLETHNDTLENAGCDCYIQTDNASVPNVYGKRLRENVFEFHDVSGSAKTLIIANRVNEETQNEASEKADEKSQTPDVLSSDIGVSSEGLNIKDNDVVFDHLFLPNRYDTTTSGYVDDLEQDVKVLSASEPELDAAGGTIWLYDMGRSVETLPQADGQGSSWRWTTASGGIGNLAYQVGDDNTNAPHRITGECSDEPIYYMLAQSQTKLSAPTKLDNLNLIAEKGLSSYGNVSFNAAIECCGNKFVAGKHVKTNLHQKIDIFGGAFYLTDDGEDAQKEELNGTIVLTDGNYHQVFGAGGSGIVNTDISISGTANADTVYGSGIDYDITGNAFIDIRDNAKINEIYGGGLRANYDTGVDGNITINMNGGHANKIYAGSNAEGYANSSVVDGDSTINLCARDCADALYGDVRWEIAGDAILNVLASNKAEISTFDKINVVGKDVVFEVENDAPDCRNISVYGGATLILDEPLNLAPDYYATNPEAGFRGDTERDNSTLVLNGGNIKDGAALTVSGAATGHTVLDVHGNKYGKAFIPKYSQGDTYYYYVIAENGEEDAFTAPHGEEYAVHARQLDDGRIGWYIVKKTAEEIAADPPLVEEEPSEPVEIEEEPKTVIVQQLIPNAEKVTVKIAFMYFAIVIILLAAIVSGIAIAIKAWRRRRVSKQKK